MLPRLFFVTFLLSILSQSHAANYYVGASATGDGTGRDTNNLITLSNVNSVLMPGDTAYLLDSRGVYSTSIAPQRSGTSESARIKYLAYNNHKPTIKMGSSLTGWSKVSGTDGVDAIYRKEYGVSYINPILLIIDTIEQKGEKSFLVNTTSTNVSISGQCGATNCINRSRPACYSNSCMRPGDHRWENGYLYLRTYESDNPNSHAIRAINLKTFGLALNGRSYITVFGITVEYPQKFAELYTTNYITLENNTFNYAFGSGTIHITDSSYFVFRNNTLKGGGNVQAHQGDAMYLNNVDYSLIEGNTISWSAHQCINARDTRYTIYKNNSFSKCYGKNIQVTGGNTITNVIEHNLSKDSPNADQIKDIHWADHGGTAIGGTHTIVRYNQYWNNSVAMDFSSHTADPSYTSTLHHVYHNVAYGSRPTRGATSGSGIMFYADQHVKPVIVNNIFAENKGGYEYGTPLDGQIGMRIPSHVNTIQPIIENNILWTSGNLGQVFYSSSIPEYESQYPNYAKNNVGSNPLFMNYNETSPDFRLRNGSAAIDKGRFLTKTSAPYSGNSVKVTDARFFIDGFGITSGDKIKIGSNPVVTITNIDYSTNTITHNGNIIGYGNEGVSFDYTGAAPDIGVFEYGLNNENVASNYPPSPPTNLSIQILQ